MYNPKPPTGVPEAFVQSVDLVSQLSIYKKCANFWYRMYLVQAIAFILLAIAFGIQWATISNLRTENYQLWQSGHFQGAITNERHN